VAPLLAAALNAPGTGRLRSEGDGTWLSWRAPGSATFGPAVHCPGDGDYVLTDGLDADKWIRVAVHADYLPEGAAEAEVFLADRYNNDVGGPDVSAAEAVAGDVEDYQLSLQNDGGQRLSNLRVWLDPTADARTSIGWNGVDFSAPTNEEEGLLRDLLEIDESVALHVRRTVPAEESSTPKELVHVHLAFDQA